MPALILILILFLAQAAAIAVLVWVAAAAVNRSRRASALWLLAVVTRRKLPLADEFEAFGDGVLAVDKGRVFLVSERLRDGATLGEALAAAPGLIPEDAELLTRVGERTGLPADALSGEAERLLASAGPAGTGGSPSLSAMYLAGVPLAMSLILTGLAVFIVPKYKKIFDDFGIDLPVIAEATFDVLYVAGDYASLAIVWLTGLAFLFGLVSLAMRASGRALPRPRPRWPGRRARAPVVLRSLALAAQAGRPFADALDPLAETAPRAIDRRRYAALRRRYADGGDLWRALSDGRYLSPREAELLAAAERAGNLPWALRHVADRLEVRRRDRLAVFAEVAQPMLVVLLGLLVFAVFAAFFLPLVTLLEGLS